MQRFYYLITTGPRITQASNFYTVAVPSTAQGKRDLHFLQMWANETGNYWHVRDASTAEFIIKIASSLDTDLCKLPMQMLKARCLVDFIKRNGCTPKCSEVRREAAHLRKILYPSDYFLRQLHVIRKAEADKRNKPKSEDVRRKGRKNLISKTPSVDGVRI